MAIEIRKNLTPDDVLRMIRCGDIDSDAVVELVDGELIELAATGFQGGKVSVRIVVALGVFSQTAGGWVLDSSTGFKVGSNHLQLRSPDASYIAPGRAEPEDDAFIDGAPDLAVEVLSPDQYGPAYARTKVREYFDAGARLVWLVHPKRQEVRVYRPGADEFAILKGDAVLSLEPIAAGFALIIADIFR